MKFSPVSNNYITQNENRQSFEGIRYKKEYLSAAQNALAEKILSSKNIDLFKTSQDIHLSIEKVPFSKKNIFYRAWKGTLERVNGYIDDDKCFKCTAKTARETIDSNLQKGVNYAEKHSAKHIDDTILGKVANALEAAMDIIDNIFK